MATRVILRQMKPDNSGDWLPTVFAVSDDLDIEAVKALYVAGYDPTITLDGDDPDNSPMGFHLKSPVGEEIFTGQLLMTSDEMAAADAAKRKELGATIRGLVDSLFKRGLEHHAAMKQAEQDALDHNRARYGHDGKSA